MSASRRRAAGGQNGPVSEQEQDRLAQVRWLASPAAVAPLHRARDLLAMTDPLAAGSRLRQELPDLPVALVTACLEQATVSRLAEDRYGIGPGLLLTRDGLEAATRPEVAARRARLLADANARQVVDLTGGLGFDAMAFANAGLHVTAVERDPAVAVALAHNCPSAQVVVGSAEDVIDDLLAALGPDDVVFVDPARRDPGGPRDARTARARPERDPERWSPPWSFVAGIRHPRVAAKVAPGFTPPADWCAEWVSVDRTVVECAAYSWPLLPARRQAVVFAAGAAATLAADDVDQSGADHLGAWLIEPDPAVVRAGGLASLAAHTGVSPLGADSTWLTGDHCPNGPLVRGYRVVTQLGGATKQQRRALADLGVIRATVKSRDVDVDPNTLLRSLGLSEGGTHVLVLTRRAGRTIVVLTEPAPARSR